VKKREVGYQETAKPLTAIEDFCERFDRAVKNTITPEVPGGPGGSGPMYAGGGGGGAGGRAAGGSLPSTPSKKSAAESSSTSTDAKPKTTATAGRNKVLPKEVG
jgi:hypothetical protein